jgi:transposase
VGRCRSCGRRVQPRHPEQTSDALGAAGAQLGPRAVALAAWLSKGLGVPAVKIARLLGQLGLGVTLVESGERSPGPLAAPSPPTSG